MSLLGKAARLGKSHHGFASFIIQLIIIQLVFSPIMAKAGPESDDSSELQQLTAAIGNLEAAMREVQQNPMNENGRIRLHQAFQAMPEALNNAGKAYDAGKIDPKLATEILGRVSGFVTQSAGKQYQNLMPSISNPTTSQEQPLLAQKENENAVSRTPSENKGAKPTAGVVSGQSADAVGNGQMMVNAARGNQFFYHQNGKSQEIEKPSSEILSQAELQNKVVSYSRQSVISKQLPSELDENAIERMGIGREEFELKPTRKPMIQKMKLYQGAYLEWAIERALDGIFPKAHAEAEAAAGIGQIFSSFAMIFALIISQQYALKTAKLEARTDKEIAQIKSEKDKYLSNNERDTKLAVADKGLEGSLANNASTERIAYAKNDKEMALENSRAALTQKAQDAQYQLEYTKLDETKRLNDTKIALDEKILNQQVSIVAQQRDLELVKAGLTGGYGPGSSSSSLSVTQNGSGQLQASSSSVAAAITSSGSSSGMIPTGLAPTTSVGAKAMAPMRLARLATQLNSFAPLVEGEDAEEEGEVGQNRYQDRKKFSSTVAKARSKQVLLKGRGVRGTTAKQMKVELKGAQLAFSARRPKASNLLFKGVRRSDIDGADGEEIAHQQLAR